MVVVETQKQPIGIKVIQSFNAIITTIGVETMVAPNMDVRRGVVIGFTINVDHGLGEFLVGGNLSKSSKLPALNIGVVGTSQMVFTNPIIIVHVHKTTNQPSMNSIATRRYKSINVEDPKRGH
jgi:hypothetical protein